MWNKLSFIFVSFLVLLIFTCEIYAKKSRKSKRNREDQDATTPQPDIVTYSSFGYADAGESYDGFVPSSPDYASYLSTYNQETTTRLYAPAFPTAMDNTGPEGYNNYDPQSQDNQGFDTGGPQSEMLHYQQNAYNSMNPSSFSDSENIHVNNIARDVIVEDGDDSAPVYGTKLGSRTKNKHLSYFNDTRSTFESIPPTVYAEKSPIQQYTESESSPLTFDTENKNYRNIYNYAPTFPTSNTNNYESKPNSNSGISFPKVVDFTKYKISYPTEIENKYLPDTTKASQNYDMKETFTKDDAKMTNNYKYHNPNIRNVYKDSPFHNNDEKSNKKPMQYNYQDSTNNHLEYANTKYNYKNNDLLNEYKDKVKSKFIMNHDNNNNLDSNTWRNSFKNMSNIHSNYQDESPFQNSFATNDGTEANIVDLTYYRFPKNSFSYFNDNNNQPQGSATQLNVEYANNNEWKNMPEYQKPKNPYQQTAEPTSTSYWGKNFVSYSSPSTYKASYKKPQLQDEENEDVIHIPKKHHGNKYNYAKYNDYKPSSDYRTKNKPNPFKFSIGKPIDEWNEEVANRFKSEEDLLGLRTQDTSHPSYLPTFKYNDPDDIHNYASNFDYKGTIEKWRQSYLKSKKYKNYWKHRDSDTMGSESQPVHVPIPKPYPVEVPHPVIVPVPQPYPVRVPVPRPVAVPVIRELTVPVEKPVPYPVIKKVPYPVEKPVPVLVEKTVTVPVDKPYPVPIPHVRPVFHHSRPTRDEAESLSDPEDHDFDDEYYRRRPLKSDSRGTKRVIIRKRPKSSRSQTHRPSNSYQDRNRRRWPSRHPTSSRPQPFRSSRPLRPRRPSYYDYDD